MSNRIYTNNKPKITDAEIDAYQDFDAVLNKVTANTGPNPSPESVGTSYLKDIVGWGKGLAIAAVGAVAIWFGISTMGTGADTSNNVVVADSTVAEEQFVAPIQPPIPGAETQYTTYTIDAQKSQKIITDDGTTVSIEKNTFVDADGNTIVGEVEVLFREYHNPLDIFKSGIPMEYDSAGQVYTFESAGMFDLQAEYKGERVSTFAKEIVVDIVGENRSTKYNDYYYDTTTRNWSYLAKSTLNPLEETEDEGSLEAEVPTAIASEIEPAINTPAPTQPTMPKLPALLSAKYAFEAEFDARKFPELYKGCVFQVDETQSTFSPAYYSVKWDMVELTPMDVSNRYNLHLEKGSQVMDVQCFPAITQQEYNRVKKAYDDSLQVYQQWQAAQPTAQQAGWGDHFLAEEEYAIMNSVNTRRVRARLPGVYNCDHPMFAQKYMGDRVQATFIDTAGQTVAPIRNYVVERGFNALFSARNNNELLLSKQKKLIVWVWTQDHQIGLVRGDQLTQYSKTETFDVELYDSREGLAMLEKLL